MLTTHKDYDLMRYIPSAETANTSLKVAPFGRWTPQKRGASYLGLYVGFRHRM